MRGNVLVTSTAPQSGFVSYCHHVIHRCINSHTLLHGSPSVLIRFVATIRVGLNLIVNGGSPLRLRLASSCMSTSLIAVDDIKTLYFHHFMATATMVHLRDAHGTFKRLSLLANLPFSKRTAYHTTIPTTILSDPKSLNGP